MLFAFCLLGLTLAALAGAQIPSPLPAATSFPTPTIKADVRQVLVPAVVTDKEGQPVSGLKESDFVVFEDEKPQHIVAFRKIFGSSLETIATDLSAVSEAARRTPAWRLFPRLDQIHRRAHIWSALTHCIRA